MTHAIGVAGSHRTGKSTLCKEFSKYTGIPYIQTGASETFKRLGMDPQASYSLGIRLSIQAEILSDLEAMYKKAPPFFITDRTPLDAAGYMLSEYNRSSLHEVKDEEIMAYLDRCEDIGSRYFHAYLIVQPGIPIKHDATKAPALPAYMEHLNSVIVGLALSSYVRYSDVSIMPRNMLNLGDRVVALSKMSESSHKKFGVETGADKFMVM